MNTQQIQNVLDLINSQNLNVYNYVNGGPPIDFDWFDFENKTTLAQASEKYGMSESWYSAVFDLHAFRRRATLDIKHNLKLPKPLIMNPTSSDEPTLLDILRKSPLLFTFMLKSYLAANGYPVERNENGECVLIKFPED